MLTASPHARNSAAPGCPVHGHGPSHQKTAPAPEPLHPPIEVDAAGVWHIRDYDLARTIMRSDDVRQAGFGAEIMADADTGLKPPVLFQDGRAHQEQRKLTARFFTPRTADTQYRELMERYAGDIIAELRQKRQADISKLTMQLAVNVAARIVGLTDSRLPGMARRLMLFFASDPTAFSWRPKALYQFVRSQIVNMLFFYLDVKPAIAARRREPREDVISHLLSQGANDAEILIECITYAAAGMVTTREFISVAVWHLLEQPELLARYRAGSEEERYAILHEILRLEPVVSHLFRRAVNDVELTLDDGTTRTIPAGALIDLHLYGINADEDVVGAEPLLLRADRDTGRVPRMVMSFGDGPHRCPGAFVAIQETDILLNRLLRIESLRIVSGPKLTWHPFIRGYEIREFQLAV